MTRLNLFEVHDLNWVPHLVRESVVEVLGTTMRWGKIVPAMSPAFKDFWDESHGADVLEMCSGSGETAALLFDTMTSPESPAIALRIILSDLVARPQLWRSICLSRQDRLSFLPFNLDATAIPDSVLLDRSQLILNAFHHFPPEAARNVLKNACLHSRGIFIAENFGRSPLETISCGVFGIPATFANPWRTPRQRVLKFLLTFVLPVIPLAVVWDGLVSSLRVYTRENLMEMTRDLDAFEWRHGIFHYMPFGRGQFFYGVPRTRQDPCET
jgi:hypothetical protein